MSIMLQVMRVNPPFYLIHFNYWGNGLVIRLYGPGGINMTHIELWNVENLSEFKNTINELERWIIVGTFIDIKAGRFKDDPSYLVHQVIKILNHIDKRHFEEIKRLDDTQFDLLGETIQEIRYNINKLDRDKFVGPGNIHILLLKRLLTRVTNVYKYHTKSFEPEELVHLILQSDM